MLNKHMRCFSVMIALIMILTSFGSTVAEQAKRKMESPADADEWTAVFLGEHPEELEGNWAMSAQMEAAVTQMGGIAVLAKQIAPGTVVEGKTSRLSLKPLKALNWPCRCRLSENFPAS